MRLAIVTLFWLAAPAFNETPRPGIIGQIKEVERDLGYQQTKVFTKSGSTVEAYYYCYYTEKLTLPASYENLRFERGTAAGCRIDPDKYDVFFYPMEAVASDKTTVTEKLAQATLERQAVVVSHEDFHVQEPIKKLPEPLAEAATTLVGFLTAAEYARRQFGASSDTHQRLAADAALYRGKAELVNNWHEKLSALYEAARRGEIGQSEALAQKQQQFEQLRQACESLPPSSSFNRCPAALNNAGLAFDMTYTHHYPLMYEVYLARGRDARATIETINRASSQPDPERYLREVR